MVLYISLSFLFALENREYRIYFITEMTHVFVSLALHRLLRVNMSWYRRPNGRRHLTFTRSLADCVMYVPF